VKTNIIRKLLKLRKLNIFQSRTALGVCLQTFVGHYIKTHDHESLLCASAYFAGPIPLYPVASSDRQTGHVITQNPFPSFFSWRIDFRLPPKQEAQR
jgi:hypothetical protein